MPQRYPTIFQPWLVVVLVALCGTTAHAVVEIPITIEELLPDDQSGVARTGAPLRFGVPLPESAAVDGTTPVSIPGCETPQTRALATYPNGRWRWMLVETLADLTAGERRTTTLTVGSGGFSSGAALASETSDAIVVQTGAASFRIRKQNWNGLDAVTVGGATWIAGGHDGGFVVADSGGAIFRSALDAASSAAIETNGPLLATVVSRGWVRNAAGAALFAYTARLRFARDRAEVEMELTLRNAELALLRPVRMRWAKFELPIAAGVSPDVAFGLNGAPVATNLDSAAALVLYQGRTTFREDSKTNGYVRPRMTDDLGVLVTSPDTLNAPGNMAHRLDGWLSLGGDGTFTGNAAVCLAVRDLAPLYPTGMRLEAVGADGVRRLSYDILSPSNTRTTPLIWAWGAHHTGVATLSFGASPQQTWSAVQFPLFARPAFEWVREHGAIYGETRLVDLATEVAWFASMGKNYTTSPPQFADLDVRRYYDFGSTGGPNQYDENLTFVVDYLRAGQRARLLQALQDAAWKSDQAVVRSDDFDYGTRAYGETDLEVSDPDGWNGKGRNTTFENEHPHWLTLPVLYWLTGNERLREAAVDYCEWRRYKAGNHSYGPIYGKGMSSLRLWSRAWRDIAMAWEFTGIQRYYDDMVRMTQAVVDSRESPGVRGRNLQRGYLYVGDWSSASRPIRLFFLDAIHGTDARESYRLLPDGPLRENFRDYLVGLAYFTMETRLGAQNSGFPYTYNLDAATTPGTRGDQIGMLMAHGYEWTGDATFVQYARDLAWRTIVGEDWERGSEAATLVRCWTDLHRNERGVGWITDLEVTRSGSTALLEWTAPEGASAYIAKYADAPMIPHLWFDAVARTYRHDPTQYTNFWAGSNVQGEPTPGAAGTRETMTITGLDPSRPLHFAVRAITTSPVASEVANVSDLAASDDEYGRVSLAWTLPVGAVGARVVRNDTEYAGFAYFPSDGTTLVGSASAAVDSATGAGSAFERGHTFYYTVFAQDAAGRFAPGARLAVTYDPPPLSPLVDASAAPVSGESPLTVAFTGSATDPDGDLASVVWDPGDGTTPITGENLEHTYVDAGSYTARCIATDAGGRSRQAGVSIEVLPAAPPDIMVEADGAGGRAPLAIRYRATATDASGLADTVWVFDTVDTTHATSATHTWTTGGRHVARFFAVDAHGRAAQDSIVVQLAPPDTEAPRYVSIAPSPGATRVARDADIVVALADSATGIDADSLVLEVNGATVVPQVEAAGTNADSLVMRYTPPAAFGYGQQVSVRLRATDRAASPNAADSTWSFAVDPDAQAPVLVSATPAAGATEVARRPTIEFALTDALSGLNLDAIQLWVAGQSVTPVASGDVTAATFHYTPATPFAHGATIAVRVRAPDRAATPNVLDTNWSFTTEADSSAPELVSIWPGDGASGIDSSAEITLELADAESGIDPATVRLWVNGIEVSPRSESIPVGIALWWARAGGFAPGSMVTATVRARDRAATPNTLEASWSFGVAIAPVLVNFQPASFATPSGYRADAGAVYLAARGFGWSAKVATASVSGTLDPRLRSYAEITNKTPATWQLALPAGSYAVSLVVASPANTGLHRVEIEGALIVNNVATSAGQKFEVKNHAVAIHDGFLTVRAGGIAGNTKKTKLCYLEVRSAATEGSSPSARETANHNPVIEVSATPGTGAAPLAVAFAATTSDPDGDAPACAWSFGDGGTASGSAVTHIYTAAGNYLAIATATDSEGATASDSVQVVVTAAVAAAMQPVRVNFQPDGFATPAEYVADNGLVFESTRGFGWSARMKAESTTGTMDPRLRSWVEVTNSTPATWQLVLPAGMYRIALAVGSPTFTGLHRIEVEGVLLVNNVATSAGQKYEVTNQLVQVSDGFLTVRAGGIAGSTKKTKLCYLDVQDGAAATTAGLAGEAPESQPGGRSSWCVDFQPRSGLAPVGSLVDVGGPFDTARGYGWIGRVHMRAGGEHLDGRVETHARVANPKSATWQLALPRGSYAVTMVLGSPESGGTQHVEIEGEVAVSRLVTAPGKFHVLRNHPVQVRDGFLTLDLGGVQGTRRGTQLCWIDVRPAVTGKSAGRTTSDSTGCAPPDSSPAIASKHVRRFQFAPRDHAIAPGFVASHGEMFDRGRGFGWDRAVETGRGRTNLGAVRNGWVEVENAHPATFTVLVPNGRYRVHVSAGSAAGTGRHQVGVEGVSAIRDVPTRPGGVVEVRVLEVVVRDGALSVMAGGAGRSGSTKLSSLEIESLDAESSLEPATAVAPEPGLRVVRARSRAAAPSIEVTTQASASLRLAIYDVRGRRVRMLYSAPAPAGTLRLAWDGRDDHGATAAAGIYFVRADLARRTYTSKLLLVR